MIQFTKTSINSLRSTCVAVSVVYKSRMASSSPPGEVGDGTSVGTGISFEEMNHAHSSVHTGSSWIRTLYGACKISFKGVLALASMSSMSMFLVTPRDMDPTRPLYARRSILGIVAMVLSIYLVFGYLDP